MFIAEQRVDSIRADLRAWDEDGCTVNQNACKWLGGASFSSFGASVRAVVAKLVVAAMVMDSIATSFSNLFCNQLLSRGGRP